MSPRGRGLRRGLLTAAALLAICLTVLAVLRLRHPGDVAVQPAAGAEQAPTALGGPFRLANTRGATVTDATLRGRPYALFFGFTRCPDACPTTISRMALLNRRLGADAGKLAYVFVSVDPHHDKPADIASFLSMFDVPVIGLTGNETELKGIERAFGVYVNRVPLPNGDYTIDHSTTVYLMDRDGRFFEPMSATEPVDDNLAQLRKLIAI
jgi:protein SCO1/2